MRESYIKAMGHGDPNTKRLFSRISDLFVREPDTDAGLGMHYIVDLVTTSGNSGSQLVSIVCENHDIPIFFEGREVLPIRDIVTRILDHLPPRCAIVLDIRDNELLQKVRNRIANTHCDLKYRRVVFCLVDRVMPSGSSAETIHVPGSVDDKMAMLLYHVPGHIQNQVESLRPLAEAMDDYDIFNKNVWRNIRLDGTLDEFLSTAMYQIVRRVCIDPGIGDDYPSFEQGWRSVMATRLKDTLLVPPDALCPSIHRVIPIGCSPLDAMQAMEMAVPKNVQNPYVITVKSSAVDDRCGAIVISQPMQYTVVNVNCMIDPGLLVDVCRELRTGYKDVVREVHSMRKELSNMTSIHEETKMQLIASMTALATTLTSREDTGKGPMKCSKHGCINVVTKRFRSGKSHRQCTACLNSAHMGRSKNSI